MDARRRSGVIEAAALAAILSAACTNGSPEHGDPPSARSTAAPSSTPPSLAKDDPDRRAPTVPRRVQRSDAEIASDVWMTRRGCERAIRERVHDRSVTPSLRIGSWNVRLFPRNSATDPKAPTNTDIDWLACAIAWLDADVLAMQEIENDTEAVRGQHRLVQALRRYSGRNYELMLDRCPERKMSHVAILFDANRVDLTRGDAFNSLLVGEKECTDNVHPGVTALIRDPGGFEFLFIALHLSAHGDNKNFERRQKQFAALKDEMVRLRQKNPRMPLIATGDFNTIGCEECDEKIETKEEVSKWSSAFVSAREPMDWLSPRSGCSAYRGTNPILFDHFVVTSDVPVVQDDDGGVDVEGMCRLQKCERLDDQVMPAYEQRLSDHCPVLVTVRTGKPPSISAKGPESAPRARFVKTTTGARSTNAP